MAKVEQIHQETKIPIGAILEAVAKDLEELTQPDFTPERVSKILSLSPSGGHAEKVIQEKIDQFYFAKLKEQSLTLEEAMEIYVSRFVKNESKVEVEAKKKINQFYLQELYSKNITKQRALEIHDSKASDRDTKYIAIKKIAGFFEK